MTLRNYQLDLQVAVRALLVGDNSDPDAANDFYCVHTFIGDKVVRSLQGVSYEEWKERGITYPYAAVGISKLPSEEKLPATDVYISIELFAARDQEVGGQEAGDGLQLLAARINTLMDQVPVALSAKVTNLVVAKCINTYESLPAFNDEKQALQLSMRFQASVLTSDF